MKKEDIENKGRIEREKVIKELQEGYNKHHDINLYTAASATIGQYALPLFVAGAKWRINSVWHSNTELPNRNIDKYYSGEAILIQTVDGKLNFGIVYYGYGFNGNMYYTVTCMDKTYTMDEIRRWAYIKDLTPDMEE